MIPCLSHLQVDAGLTFNKKDLEHSFIFDIKTIDRVFYLVADTEEEMNKWVRCICDICGFNPTDDGEVDVPALGILRCPTHTLDGTGSPQLSMHLYSAALEPDTEEFNLVQRVSTTV